jgi:hypothetical protein
MAERVLILLQQYQPPKYAPPPEEGMRRRPPHTSISEGWDAPKTRTTYMGGASAIIQNRSEHIDVIRYGHGFYTVPRSGTAFQRFYFPPERAYNSYIAQMLAARVAMGLNPILGLYFTRHEAKGPWGGGDFVMKAARQAQQPMRTVFHEAADKIAYAELRTFFRGAG